MFSRDSSLYRLFTVAGAAPKLRCTFGTQSGNCAWRPEGVLSMRPERPFRLSVIVSHDQKNLHSLRDESPEDTKYDAKVG